MSQLSDNSAIATELFSNAITFLEQQAITSIEQTQQKFTTQAKSEISDKKVSRLNKSYISVASLQAWRKAIYETKSKEIHDLFLEAQNDALLSFTLAHIGMWRPALQSLRSFLEGMVRIAYFDDHPVEFVWWQSQKHKISTTRTLKLYLSKHPKIAQSKTIAPALPDYLKELASEYSTLSKAVHASSTAFFMTKEGDIEISTDEEKYYNPWYKRHDACIRNVNLLLLCMHQDKIQGTGNRDLRQLISLTIPVRHHAEIAKLGIKLR